MVSRFWAVLGISFLSRNLFSFYLLHTCTPIYLYAPRHRTEAIAVAPSGPMLLFRKLSISSGGSSCASPTPSPPHIRVSACTCKQSPARHLALFGRERLCQVLCAFRVYVVVLEDEPLDSFRLLYHLQSKPPFSALTDMSQAADALTPQVAQTRPVKNITRAMCSHSSSPRPLKLMLTFGML